MCACGKEEVAAAAVNKGEEKLPWGPSEVER